MKRSRLGQNFLLDPSIAERIVDVSGVGPDDTVIEIGPGHGIMTRFIASRAKELIAIELDNSLFDQLKRYFIAYDNITLLHMDVMKYDFSRHGPFKVIANIPYYITTPIIFKLIEEENQMDSMTLTIQKEVAERIVASPGNKQYGVLSLMVQFYGKAEIIFTISAGAFRPTPKVNSAVIKIERHLKPPVDVANEDIFRRIIKTSFAGRRKMLSNSLKAVHPDIKTLLMRSGIDPSRRPETLSMKEFAIIANTITQSLPIDIKGMNEIPSTR
jgi:16S rRNA (adenine1518-N6/adenine1519-N6)-dimethyltransferase